MKTKKKYVAAGGGGGGGPTNPSPTFHLCFDHSGNLHSGRIGFFFFPKTFGQVWFPKFLRQSSSWKIPARTLLNEREKGVFPEGVLD